MIDAGVFGTKLRGNPDWPCDAGSAALRGTCCMADCWGPASDDGSKRVAALDLAVALAALVVVLLACGGKDAKESFEAGGCATPAVGNCPVLPSDGAAAALFNVDVVGGNCTLGFGLISNDDDVGAGVAESPVPRAVGLSGSVSEFGRISADAAVDRASVFEPSAVCAGSAAAS